MDNLAYMLDTIVELSTMKYNNDDKALNQTIDSKFYWVNSVGLNVVDV